MEKLDSMKKVPKANAGCRLTMSALRHPRAILLLPFLVTVVIPPIILWLTSADTFDLWESSLATRLVLAILGSVSICLGLVLMVATMLRPWTPDEEAHALVQKPDERFLIDILV